jgi:hypothetical protein
MCIQWLNGSTNNDMIIRNGVILTSSLPLMLTPSALEDKFSNHMISNIRDVEKQINGQLLQQENNAAGDYVAFIYGGEWGTEMPFYSSPRAHKRTHTHTYTF